MIRRSSTAALQLGLILALACNSPPANTALTSRSAELERAEASYLEQGEGKARRSGDTLFIPLTGGGAAVVVDDTTNADAWVRYMYIGPLARTPFIVVMVGYYEGRSVLLVNGRSGQKTYIDAEPVPSPSGGSLAVASMDMEAAYDPTRLTIYRVEGDSLILSWRADSIEWGPDSVAWQGEDSLFVSQAFPTDSGPGSYDYRSTWVVREGEGWRSAPVQDRSTPARHHLVMSDFNTTSLTTPGDAPWFGLYAMASEGFELRRVAVSIQEVEGGCAGRVRSLSTPGPATPLLLVAGVPGLREGEVVTAFNGRRYLEPSGSVALMLGSDSASSLSATGTLTPHNGGTAVTDYHLVLQTGRRSQVVASFRQLDGDGLPQLRWAGDLDRDGRIDILADLRTHYASHRYALLISSMAPTDSLVGLAAEQRVGGC